MADRIVALRKESVDRNIISRRRSILRRVALRKESVDRNPIAAFLLMWWQSVALRKESVDRNNRLNTGRFNVKRRSSQGERG